MAGVGPPGRLPPQTSRLPCELRATLFPGRSQLFLGESLVLFCSVLCGGGRGAWGASEASDWTALSALGGPGVHAVGLLTLWFAVVLMFCFLFSSAPHRFLFHFRRESRIKSSFYFLSTLPPTRPLHPHPTPPLPPPPPLPTKKKGNQSNAVRCLPPEVLLGLGRIFDQGFLTSQKRCHTYCLLMPFITS